MLDYELCLDKDTGEPYIATSIKGKSLLTIPQLNKGTAFSERERHELGLIGKLPLMVEDLSSQVKRAYLQFQSYQTDMQKNIYLNNLHDNNQVVFYKLILEHLTEMVPLIYTPIVGNAVKKFSVEFRQPRGIYLSYPERDLIQEVLINRSNPKIDLIVVSDGESVLGIGDQGVGAIDIPIAKLMVYTLFGGINPNRAIPIVLDVGTNNEELLNDPFYLGWRHPRLQGKEYHYFIELVVKGIQEVFPKIFLHFEDFGRENAKINLDKFRHQVCSFNDDIQGTGVAALSALLTACQLSDQPLTKQRIVIFGAGTAGMGIAEQICDALMRQGLSQTEAHACFWLIDRQGLLLSDMVDLTQAQRPYARPAQEAKIYQRNVEGKITLEEVVRQLQPTVLIGSSAQTGAFTQDIITEMATHCQKPIIFPLSNPNWKCEAQPNDVITWTGGRALVATGSPFAPVLYQGKTYVIAQCNNALVFPGIGLGVIACAAQELTNDMIWQSACALTEFATANARKTGALLPSIEQAPDVALDIALAVAKNAFDTKLARQDIANPTKEELRQIITQLRWYPKYLPYRYRPKYNGV